MIEDIASGLDRDTVRKIQASILFFEYLLCNFSSQLNYDKNVSHLRKQS